MTKNIKLKQYSVLLLFFILILSQHSTSPMAYANGAEHERKTEFKEHETQEAKEYSEHKKQKWLNSLNNENINKLIKSDENKIPISKIMYSQSSFENLGLTTNFLDNIQANHTDATREYLYHTFVKQFMGTNLENSANLIFVENFLKLRLTPNYPENLQNGNKLNVKLSIPMGNHVAYIGNGEAVLPKDTFIKYNLNSFRITPTPTGDLYSINAYVINSTEEKNNNF